MRLNRGRTLTAMPGPSVIPDRVLDAMHNAMPNIYQGDLVETSMSLFDELPAIARTSGKAFITISNGHGAWEMALTNTLNRGDGVLVLESGRFAPGWGDQASVLGADVDVLNAEPRSPIDPDAVERRLRADTEHRIKAILAVQVDTASGVWNDIEAIGRAIRAAGHPALFMVDCVASIGCVEYLMDDWGVDVTVGGSQKGLMVPPGLGLVWANDRALAAHENADMRSPYWNWTPRLADDMHYLRYCGTPPVQHIYAMRTALDMIAEEGLETIWRRHAVFRGGRPGGGRRLGDSRRAGVQYSRPGPPVEFYDDHTFRQYRQRPALPDLRGRCRPDARHRPWRFLWPYIQDRPYGPSQPTDVARHRRDGGSSPCGNGCANRIVRRRSGRRHPRQCAEGLIPDGSAIRSRPSR